MKLQVFGRKALDAIEREAGLGPEQRAARRLGPLPAATLGPKVLFLTPRSWAVHVQWEAAIGRALAGRGARVSFSTCGGGRTVCDRVHVWEGPPPPCRTCRGYTHRSLSAHGHRWEPLRDDDSPDPTWPELDELGLDELRAVEWSGLPLGQLVTVPVSWFLCTTDLSSDPLAALTMRRFLRAAAGIADELARRLDAERPDIVVMLNGMFLFEQVARALCAARTIDVVTYERGYIKDTVFFHRGRTASRYDTDLLWEQARHRPLTAEQDAELDAYLADRRVGGRSINDFWPAPRFDEPEPGFAVLFTNVTWDTAVQERERCFTSAREWLVETVRWFVDRPGRRLVVRVHPAEIRIPGAWTREPAVDLLASAFGELPTNVRVLGPDDPTSSYPLMAAADVALVYTSTAGMESVLTGTPCVTAATTQFGGKGFTIDPPDRDGYFAVLDAASTDPASLVADVELARRYAWFFFFAAALRTERWVCETQPGLARVTDDPRVFEPGGDPDLEVICRGILEGTPFIRQEREG